MNVDHCPSPATLADFGLGRLGADEFAVVATHVEGCERCQDSLSRLSDSDDLLVWELRQDVAARPEDGAEVPHAPTMTTFRVSVEVGAQLPRQLGQYLLLEPLGAGGMGAVFKAQHVKLRKFVAVKLLPPERTRDPATIARFHREMEAVGKLDHPNIVRATDAGEFESLHYLAMELVDGVDLAKLLRRHGPLAVGEACDAARQAALGLDHAYRHALVHRDIKPSNLLATRDGTIKILDMGLALLQEAPSVAGELTCNDHVLGTADYMAPEQWQAAHAVDIRADIYSLGCTLFQLLVGAPPFGSDEFSSLFRKMAAHRECPPPDLAEIRPDIPPDLAVLVARMLAKRPEDRPQTPAVVAACLTPWATGSQLGRLVADGQDAPDAAASRDPTLTRTPAYAASALTDTRPQRTPSSAPIAAGEERRTAAAACRRRPIRTLAGASLLAAMIVAAVVYVIRVEAAKGTIEFDSVDKDVSIELSGPERATIIDLRTKNEIRVREGEYEVRLANDANSLRVENGSVTLTRGDRVVVRIRRRPPEDGIGAVRTAEPRSPPVTRLTQLGDWVPSDADSPPLRGIIPRPAKLPGIAGRWNIETIFPRGVVRSVAFNEDDRWLACGSDDGCVRVFETQSAKLIRLLHVGEYGVGHLEWQPGGTLLATISRHGHVKLWDAQGRIVAERSADVDTRTSALAWSPDGSRIAFSMGGGKLGVFPKTLRGDPLLLVKHAQDVDRVAWSPDGAWIAASCHNDHVDGAAQPSSDAAVYLWKAVDGSPGPKLLGHADRVTHLAWKGDGKMLASSSLDATVRVWPVDVDAPANQAPQPIKLPHRGGPVLAVAWSHDDGLLATGTNGQDLVMVRAWDTDRWREEYRLPTFPQAIASLAWSHRGRVLATGTGVSGKAFNKFWGGAGYAVNVWSLADSRPTMMWPWRVHHGIRSVVWSADGAQLASIRGTGTSDTFLCLWNARDGRFENALQVSRSRPNVAAFAPSSRQLAVGGGQRDPTVRIWNLKTQQPGAVFSGHLGGIRDLTWRPGEGEIVTAGEDKKVQRWNPTNGQPLGTPLEADALALAYDTNGSQLALTTSAGIQLHASESSSTVGIGESSGKIIHALRWSPHAQLLAWCTDRPDSSVTVWDLRTRKRSYGFSYGSCGLFDVDWDPAGNRLAAAAGDGSIVVFDPAKPAVPTTMPAHASEVNGVAWSSDGSLLVSCGRDATIRAWKADTLDPYWIAIMLPGTETGGSLITFNAAGQELGRVEKPEEHLVYLREVVDGPLELFSPADFASMAGLPATAPKPDAERCSAHAP